VPPWAMIGIAPGGIGGPGMGHEGRQPQKRRFTGDGMIVRQRDGWLIGQARRT